MWQLMEKETFTRLPEKQSFTHRQPLGPATPQAENDGGVSRKMAKISHSRHDRADHGIKRVSSQGTAARYRMQQSKVGRG
eukprot:3350941-Prymnesium_polylepis.1